MLLLFPFFTPFFENVYSAETQTVNPRPGELLENGDFQVQEDAGEFTDLWTDGVKPESWDLRNWGNSGGQPPLATHHQADGNSVSIELDETVAFFQYHEAVPVDGSKTYHLESAIMTDGIVTQHASENAASIRIEHLNEEGAVLLRDDVAHFPNAEEKTDWISVNESFQPVQGTASIRIVLITGVVSPGQGSTGSIAVDFMSLTEEADEEPAPEMTNTLLKNHKFEETEQAGTFADLWHDETKPAYWDLRNWGSSNGEAPFGSVTSDGDEPFVSLDLQSTVGFFQYYDAIAVDPNRSYEIGAIVRTNDVTVPNSSGNAAFLRVEQFNGSSLLERQDIATISAGSSDWTTLAGQVETKENTTHMRLILVIGGSVTPDDGASGTIDVKAFSLSGEEAQVQSVSFTDEAIYIQEGETVSSTYELTPVYAKADTVEWSTEDPEIANVMDGDIHGVAVGETTVEITINGDDQLTDKQTVIVYDGELPVSQIDVSETAMTIVEGRSFTLFPEVSPQGADPNQLEWSVSDDDVLAVDGSFVQALSPGEAEVILKAKNSDAEVRVDVTVLPYEETEFDHMRERWVDYIVPNAYTDMTVPAIEEKVESIGKNATDLLADMKTDGEGLWEEYSDFSNSATITSNYRNLNKMAQAYTFEAGANYQSQNLLEAILYGLDWMDKHHYHDGGNDYGNWWDWQIGSPQLLNDTVAMVHDSLTEEQRTRYTDAVKHYIPEVTHYYGVGNATWRVEASGANLVDLGKAVALQGILAHEEERITSAQVHFPVVEIKESGRGNGVYIDGSFVDHSNIAYTGTYGVVFLGSMIDLIYMLTDSSFSLNESDVNVIFDMIFLSFEPVIYKGLMMDMVNGRAISRGNSEDIGHGRGAVERIIQYSAIVPESYEQRMKSMIKEWLESQPEMIDSFNRIQVITMANDILEEDTIEARGELTGHYLMTHMDRVAHRRPAYTFALSKYSDRIAAYEGNMNGENMKGHYTGSGMTYLYTDDLHQYNDGFWATIDPKRLPGITANMDRALSPGLGTGRTSPAEWVGGTSLNDLYGVSGMQLDQSVFNQTLTGHKSWFMFDDEVVALGSGISSEDGDQIETIIDSRKLAGSGLNQILINGDTFDDSNNQPLQATETDWIHLEGNTAGSDIGYFFPDSSDVHVNRYDQSGSWYDINRNGSTETITRPFAEFAIDHGVDPTDDTYAYVILPDQTPEDVENYSDSPDVAILANTKDVQAVQETSLGILAANFWSDGPHTVGSVTSYDAASVMVRTHPEDRLEISVSDPTRQNTGTVELLIEETVSAPLKLDRGVEIVEHTEDAIRLLFDVNAASGLSKTATLDLQEDSQGWLNDILVQETFEDGSAGDPVTSTDLQGDGSLTYHEIEEPILPERDFTGITRFDPQTGKVNIRYTFTPENDAIDAVMGLAGSNMTISDYPDLPVIVRASSNTGSAFDARDGSSFKADETLHWETGKSYEIEFTVDLDQENYSVKVTPDGEETVQIATDYAFRDTAETPEDIGKLIFQDNRTTYGSVITGLQVNDKAEGVFQRSAKLDVAGDSEAKMTFDVSDTAQRFVAEWSFQTLEQQGLTFDVMDANGDRLLHFAEENGALIDELTGEVILSDLKDDHWYDAVLTFNLLSGEYSISIDGSQLHKGSIDPSDPLIPAALRFGFDALSGDGEAMARSLLIDHITIRQTSVELTGINFATDRFSMTTGDDLELTPVIEPAQAFSEGLRYTSDQEAIATVNNKGVVTAHAPGVAVVTVTDLVSGITAHAEIDVTALPSADFNDVPEDHWAFDYIESLTGKGIINGYSNSEFRPASDVTRGQFIAMLARLGELTPEYPGEVVFTDQHGTLSDDITAAAQAGITEGYEDGTFKQDAFISREEVAILLARAFETFTGDALPTDGELTYKDAQSIGKTAYPYVNALTQAGIFEGTAGGHFLPHDYTKRDQTAKVLYYFLVLSE